MFAIRTKRLCLRDLLDTDLDAMHRLRTDPQVTEFFETFKSANILETKTWLSATMYHNSLIPRLSYNLMIVRQEDHASLGWIGIGQPSVQHEGDLDFGYALVPEYWGAGYATEALDSILAFSFENLGAYKIFGECARQNLASRRVMEKAGLKRVRDKRQDALVRYDINREMWELRCADVSTCPGPQ